jgi:hypothetical protein
MKPRRPSHKLSLGLQSKKMSMLTPTDTTKTPVSVINQPSRIRPSSGNAITTTGIRSPLAKLPSGARVPVSPKHPGAFSSTFNKSRSEKPGSAPGRRKKSYDRVLNSSFKRQTLLAASIEDKYSWLRRLKLAVNSN